MPTRAQREAVLQREREAYARGPLSDAERVRFDEQRAWEMRRAELRRHPSPIDPELPLEPRR